MPKVYREYENSEGTPYYENLDTKTTSWNRPSSGFFEHETNEGETYYENIQTGKTQWSLNNSGNSASTISNASSVTASSASNAEAARLREELASRNRELEELRKQLAALKTAAPSASAAPSSGPSANDPVVGKFVKMMKMGIPRSAVEQKMRMEGLEPSLLNGSGSSAAAPPRPPMGGPMAGLLAGISAGPKLKKVNVTNKKPLANAKPQKTGAQAAAASLAEEAQRKALARQQRATMSIEERIAAEKAAKEAAKAAGPKTGFAAFASELKTAAERKRSGSNSSNFNNSWSTASTPRERRSRSRKDRRRKAQRKSRKH